jgi:hypothetical protein
MKSTNKCNKPSGFSSVSRLNTALGFHCGLLTDLPTEIFLPPLSMISSKILNEWYDLQ